MLIFFKLLEIPGHSQMNNAYLGTGLLRILIVNSISDSTVLV